jgi:PGF-CTERM protein
MYDVNFGGIEYMTKRLTIALVAVALFVLLAVMPAAATFAANGTIINQSATIFIGEQGLNLTHALNQAQNLLTPGTGTNLETTPFGNTTIGWWASAANIGNSAPSATINLGSGTPPQYDSFTVAQQNFVGYTGNWYLMNSATGGVAFVGGSSANSPVVVFTVADPALDIGVWDYNQATDVTGTSVPQGEYLGFTVKTNMVLSTTDKLRGSLNTSWDTTSTLQYYPINSATDGYINLKVKDSTGATLTGLANATGTSALTSQFIATQPFYWPYNTGSKYTTTTGPVQSYWLTNAVNAQGQYAYPVGTYTVWAESALNNMKNNYKNAGADYTGKTISQTYTISLVSSTVKIQANQDSVVRSKSFSVTITGKPSTTYYLWVKNTRSMDSTYDNTPPIVAPNQNGVYNDTPNYFNNYPIGAYAYQNRAGTDTLISDVAKSSTNATNSTQYYALVNLSTSGTATVGFITTNWTKAQQYTIRVEQEFSTTSPNTAGLAVAGGAGDSFKSDEVTIAVAKGAVTIVAAGDQSYYLGEDVVLSGTNTESYKTYLFLIGPNLPTQGAIIFNSDPRNAGLGSGGTVTTGTSVSTKGVQNGVASTFQAVDVNGDNTWSWTWGTSTVALDAGTYTIYAVSQPNDANTLQNSAYGTVSVIIKKPFISATASQSTIAQGDDLYITGTAEGKPSSIQIWILGKNYANLVSTSVNTDASFSYKLASATTMKLSTGQYFVVVQHPMMNGKFDINLDATSGYVMNYNYALNSASPIPLFKLTGSSSLQGSDAAQALATDIDTSNVDDTYTKLQFLVENPVIQINPVGDKHVGDKFTITAATNLAVGDQVLVQIYSSSFKPTDKSQSGEFSGATGTVKVTAGSNGMNAVSFDVDSSTFKPDEYIVQEQAVIQQQAIGTALFNVLETTAPVATTVAPVVTTAAPVTTTAAPVMTTVPTPTPTKSPGFGALIALIGLGAVAFVVVRRH